LGSRLSVFLMSSIWLNEVAKVALHQPRPFWVEAGIETWGADSSFGLPSGHAQHAVVMWGLLAAAAHNSWAWPAACTLILLIGVSRVYLGVHFPTDVLAGWLIGAAILWTMVRLERRGSSWFGGQTRAMRVTLILAGTLALVAVATLIELPLRDWQVPAAWLHNARVVVGDRFEPTRLDFAVVAAGILGGMLVGAPWAAERLGWPTRGTLVPRMVRLALGLAVAGAVWVLTSFFVPQLPLPWFYGPLWLRTVLIGLWVSAGAPWLFRRLRLAPASGRLP
jgi:hypothetical protein